MVEGKEIGVNQLIATHQQQRQQLDSLVAQKKQASAFLHEVIAAKDALNEITFAKENDKMLVSLGAGIYMDASIVDVKEVKSTLGGNIVREISIKDAIKKLEEREEKVRGSILEIEKQEMSLAQNLAGIEKVLDEYQRKRAMAAQQQSKPTESNPNVS